MSRFKNIESLLLSDGVLTRLCEREAKTDQLDTILSARDDARKGVEDFKPAVQKVHHAARGRLELSPSGETGQAFLRDFLAPLIVPGTPEYDQLKDRYFWLTTASGN